MISFGQNSPAGPVQPLPFSHKTHAEKAKLQCKTCHPNADPGERMTIAPVTTCMACHTSIKTDSPAIQKLTEAAKAKRNIQWTRVYEVPGYVSFSHKAHIQAGGTCQECHGPVATRDQLFRETDISMGGCMACHRQKGASIDCIYCHEPQN